MADEVRERKRKVDGERGRRVRGTEVDGERGGYIGRERETHR